jgi:hypothetical protein
MLRVLSWRARQRVRFPGVRDLHQAAEEVNRMIYHSGDYVCPSDLTRRFLCRVVDAENVRIRSGIAQILKLEPLEGPWPPGTFLIRLADLVRRAQCREPSSGRSIQSRLRQPLCNAA